MRRGRTFSASASGLPAARSDRGWSSSRQSRRYDFPLRDVIADRVRLDATLDTTRTARPSAMVRGAARVRTQRRRPNDRHWHRWGLSLDGQLYHGESDVAGRSPHTIDSRGAMPSARTTDVCERTRPGPRLRFRARERWIGTSGCPCCARCGRTTSMPSRRPRSTEAANRGDALALEVVRDTAKFLGPSCQPVTFNPDAW